MKDQNKIYPDRVRAHSTESSKKDVDKTIEDNIKYYASKSKEEISARIEELDKEWDIERILESNASALALTGLLLGANRNRGWYILSGIVVAFLFQHAVQGWCPPLPLFRKLNFRTRKEIDKEKYALKVLRGDFDKIADIEYIETSEKPSYALDAVK
jgi:hypothetical protein